MILDDLEKAVGKDRVVAASPDYFEILGTDRFDNANKYFAPKFEAYRLAWRENPRNHIVGDFPLHIDFETSNTCNLRCSMCQIPFGKMKSGYLDIDMFKNIMREVKGFLLPSIKFNFRGEPLMHPKLVDFVRLAKEAGVIEVQFNSNGALLNDALSRSLIEAGLDRIKFSIDGVTPAIYDSIRIGTTYDETIPKVLKFIAVRNSLGRKLPSVQVQMVYMESNQKEILDYIGFWEDKVNRIGFSRYRSGQNRIGEKGRTQKLGERFPCHQLWQRLVMLWDGTVLMCCGDHQVKNPIGRITEKSLNEIWKSEELDNIRRLHLEGRYDEIPACVNCEVNYT